MSEIEPVSTGGGVAGVAGAVIGAAGAAVTMIVRYGIVLAQLTAAGAKLRGLSEQVRSTYTYVEGCARSVDRLADQMASLTVDTGTVGEHHEAAGVMRSVLEEAEAMAAATEDLAALFEQTADAHQADYGTVAEAAQNMPDGIDMADAQFYSNR
jgi:hypothetical protein